VTVNEGGSRGERRPAQLLLAVACLVVVAAVARTVVDGVVEGRIALAFTAFIALGELLRITLPGGRDAAPLSAAGAFGYAMLANLPGGESTHSAAQVVAVSATGMLVGLLPHVAAGRLPPADYLARRVLTVAFCALLFRPLFLSGQLESLELHAWPIALVMTGTVMLSLVFDATLAATVRAGRYRSPFRPVLRDEARAIVGIGTAVGATGLLVDLAAQTMGLWALPLFCVPLLLTQFSFRRFATIRNTYLETIRSLSRLTELGGYTETGHTHRVSQLSLAVGRDLGMSENELLDLEYAALMHDIGQLSLVEPIPGGATVMATAHDQRRIAEQGASVIRRAGVLARVADVVEAQSQPYRRLHELDDAAVPFPSRIIRAANAYDDMVGGSLEQDRHVQALERLRLGMAYEYDPRVVESLSRVVDRAGTSGG
jgi:HD domain-containing protein